MVYLNKSTFFSILISFLIVTSICNAESLTEKLNEAIGSVDTSSMMNDDPNAEPNEYVQVYDKLGGYYGEVEAVRGDTRGYLYSKASGLANDSYSSMKNSSKIPFFANSEGSFNISEDSDGDTLVDFEFLTVLPIKQSIDLKHTWFSQFSFANDEQFGDRRFRANAGGGYRNYNASMNMVLGLNTFYDHEFDSNHNRVGVGGEIKKDLLDLGINYYHALSGKKTMKIDNISGDERALSGFDVEAGHPLPFLEWTRAFFSYYYFEGEKGEDQKGFRYSTEMLLHDNLKLEAGYNDDRQSDGVDQNYWFVKFTVTSGNDSDTPTLFGTNSKPFSDTIFGTRDVSKTLKNKVRRRNKITIERIQTGAMQVGGN